MKDKNYYDTFIEIAEDCPVMTPEDISGNRIVNQQITGTKFKTVKDLVGWMGAIQAQDFNMAKWAIGIRLPGLTDKDVEELFNKGEILRTHLLRPTWHFVSADDIYWMLTLTAPHIQASMRSRNKELGLTEAIMRQSDQVIEKSLADGKHLTREEIIEALKAAKIYTDNIQAYHLIVNAELNGIICSGAIKGKKQTYALLSERAPEKNIFSRSESLAKLAIKYFASHGPATLQDFSWWSGLPVSESRKALEMVKSDLLSEKVGTKEFWFSGAVSSFDSDKKKESIFFLPAYDEFIISYKDRSPSLTSESHTKTISNNGIFRPVIVSNRRVKGIWKRTVKKEKIITEIQLFKTPDKKTKDSMEEAAQVYGLFLNQPQEIIFR